MQKKYSTIFIHENNYIQSKPKACRTITIIIIIIILNIKTIRCIITYYYYTNALLLLILDKYDKCYK